MFASCVVKISERPSAPARRRLRIFGLALAGIFTLGLPCISAAETTALWLFDEPSALYPSSALDSSSENDYPLVIGQGGRLTKGKFGNALEPTDRRLPYYPWGLSRDGLQWPWTTWLRTPSLEVHYFPPSVKLSWPKWLENPGTMSWANSRFAALMTSGESHLRKEVGFINPIETKLNLGPFDWTVEYWYRATKDSNNEGVVFEIGMGPLEKEKPITRLVLESDNKHFRLRNDPSKTMLRIPTDVSATGRWQHLAFVYSSEEKQLRHYLDGVLQPLPAKCTLKPLAKSKEAYLSLARDGHWGRPVSGRLDELRFSTGQVYSGPFQPPHSFATPSPEVTLLAGPPLLFDGSADPTKPVPLGKRKHLFLDDALVAEMENSKFVINPPTKAERVIDGIQGPFRKHLTVVEDENGVIRLYNSIHEDYLAVRRSVDGVHFDIPEINFVTSGQGDAHDPSNVVIAEMVGGLGNPFLDLNGPAEERWKYFTDYHRRGIYLYTSPDGYRWKRSKAATLPFRSGTQSCTFYDDQRQRYVSYHRSGIFHTVAGDTQRSSVATEHKDLSKPLEFTSLSQDEYLGLRKTNRLRTPLPWYLDNGPLTPGGFGMEYPHAFDPIVEDVPGTDIYITKAQKYPWAPDAYVAFPIVYFHYQPDGPLTKRVLALPERGRGSGPLETQLSVSRDGLNWTRHPRPAYVGIGRHEGRDVVTAYLAHGMVRRGSEIWQYYFGETQYHSAHKQRENGRAVYRVVQRLDGFVSIDSPYGEDALLKTKPLIFDGSRLTLNVDTDATGFVQVGILDENGKPIEGYTLDKCVYVNGDFVDTEIQWLGKGSDISKLAGKTIQLVFRMRGSKLFALQFVDR